MKSSLSCFPLLRASTTRSLFFLFRKMAALRGDRSHGGHWNSDLTAVRIGFAHSFPMKLESPPHCPVEILSETLSALFARSPSKPSIIRPVHYNRTFHYSSNMYPGHGLCCTLISTCSPRPIPSFSLSLSLVSFSSPRDSKLIPGRNGLTQHEKVTKQRGDYPKRVNLSRSRWWWLKIRKQRRL